MRTIKFDAIDAVAKEAMIYTALLTVLVANGLDQREIKDIIMQVRDLSDRAFKQQKFPPD